MPVQSTKDRRGIGTSTAKPRFAGDPLGDPDLKAVRILAHGIQIQLRRLPGQVPLITGDPFLIAPEDPRLSGTDIQLDIVPEGDGLHDALHIMIAILTLPQDIQSQIDLGISRFKQRGHRIFRPSI